MHGGSSRWASPVCFDDTPANHHLLTHMHLLTHNPSLQDVCVEIPMLGVTCSLNAHVSGAMAVWSYVPQQQQQQQQQQGQQGQ